MFAFSLVFIQHNLLVMAYLYKLYYISFIMVVMLDMILKCRKAIKYNTEKKTMLFKLPVVILWIIVIPYYVYKYHQPTNSTHETTSGTIKK